MPYDRTHSPHHSLPQTAPVIFQAAPAFSAPVLVVPGLNGSPDNHWQSIWAAQKSNCKRANLGFWDDPSPELWLSRLDQEIAELHNPAVLVAHSLGCLATAMWLAKDRRARTKIRAAVFVAPCDPYCGHSSGVLRRFKEPREALPVRSIVVASSNDPYASILWSEQLASDWGAQFIKVGRAGHINADSGLGEWLYGQAIVEGLAQPFGEVRALQ